MKKNKILLSVFVAGMLTLGSCSNETSADYTEIPQTVIETFNRLYPGASDVLWSTHGNYAVASFYYPETRNTPSGRNNNAWFAMHDGSWGMTETEIPFSALPQTVKEAFMNSPYATWKTDETVDVLKRNQTETLYVIEVEQQDAEGGREMDLYYTEDGTLVKEIADDQDDKDYDELLPQQPASHISDWINQNFPGARIIDVETEDGGTEVEIIHEQKVHEIRFDQEGNWLYTQTDLGRNGLSDVPAIVLETLKKTEAYQQMEEMDDIYRYNTRNEGVFYGFELETRQDDDVEVYIRENGELLEGKPVTDDEGEAPVQDEIKSFIENQYPGARILEKDYDDGYLEVEILHEGKKKELTFNGRNEWLRTEWELSWHELPEAVRNTLQNRYAGYEAEDDIRRIETPENSWYVVELEKGDRETEVWIDDAGQIIQEKTDN